MPIPQTPPTPTATLTRPFHKPHPPLHKLLHTHSINIAHPSTNPHTPIPQTPPTPLTNLPTPPNNPTLQFHKTYLPLRLTVLTPSEKNHNRPPNKDHPSPQPALPIDPTNSNPLIQQTPPPPSNKPAPHLLSHPHRPLSPASAPLVMTSPCCMAQNVVVNTGVPFPPSQAESPSTSAQSNLRATGT